MITDILASIGMLCLLICCGISLLIYVVRVSESEKRKNEAIVSLDESMKVLAARKENSNDQKN